MKKFLFILTGLILITGHSLAYACGGGCGGGCGSCGGCAEKNKGSVQIGDARVGNKICPVMGGEIIEGVAVEVEHEGKIYSLCCPGCINKFKSDPDQYIQKLKTMMLQDNSDFCSGEVQSCHG